MRIEVQDDSDMESHFPKSAARQHLAVPLGAGFAMCLGIDGRYYGQDLIIGK